ncbi:MAG: ATP-binding protein, partial [Chloroflexota bacterium]
VARHRLRFAATGSTLLIMVFVIAGIRLAIPTMWPDISPFIQVTTMLTIVTYYLGFAPPRWLRQGWQFAELRNYLLKDLPTLQSQSPSSVLARLRQAVMRAVGTDKVFVAIWDREGEKLVLENIPESAALLDFNLNEGIFKQVWRQPEPIVVYNTAGLSGDDIRLMKTLKAEMLFFVPFATSEGAIGLLLVFLEFGSLFVDDDLNLLTIFAQQTAMLLENFRILEEQQLYAQDLERTVQARTEALRRSNDELRQFAYVASHDLQEPLRMIVSYLQLIETRYVSQLDKDAREFIEFAVDGAKRMKNLIEGLLAYSRVETQIQNFTQVDSQKVVDEVEKLLSVAIAETGTTITHDALPKIKANEAMMTQLFQNLISNAMKYQKDNKPQIHIGATLKDKEWVFSVQDNGIGIEGKDLERIFVIFQRLHARNEYPGTGIGLAVCKKVVEHHGGHIWVESKMGEGTTFFFTIPQAV